MVQAQGGTAQAERPGPGNSASAARAVALPKGGGAIRGMGEKFAANPVTGTGSTTVPIATSPGRAGFGPQLSLAHDSSAGNAPFGFGRSISLPSITREIEKGLPRYQANEKSEGFILSGAEDSVLVYLQNANGNSVRDRGKLLIRADPHVITLSFATAHASVSVYSAVESQVGKRRTHGGSTADVCV